MSKPLIELQNELQGQLAYDRTSRNIYATDASVYQQIPRAVCWPKNTADIQRIIHACRRNHWSLTPRAAGTSLAGQAVGDDLIVDMSKHFTQILRFDPKTKTVVVQPGVVRDELNQYLHEFGLFFGPNTSTSNRCNMGGMLGNNSSGTTSIKYGSTREHVLSVKAILSDGSEVTFAPLDKKEFEAKCCLSSLEGDIYKHIDSLMKSPSNRQTILQNYPKSSVTRRNTGYALDALLPMIPFEDQATQKFNFCKLLCGSEGSLAIVTEIELSLSDLPPCNAALICVHFSSLENTMSAVPKIMALQPYALEMMDRSILQCTIGHPTYAAYRSFVEGDPFALLMIELRANEASELQGIVDKCISLLKKNNLGYAYPVLHNEDMQNAWMLRKAGLGLLANLPGNKKAVACIEDTAVSVFDLKEFILEFDQQMKEFHQKPVYYAHAGAGELHIRPLLDLKDPKDIVTFRAITRSTAALVKRYRGSLSGEHGDGRVRGEFISMVLRDEVYEMLCDLKKTWDPSNILNPGKIVHSPPMDEDLRAKRDSTNAAIATIFDFQEDLGLLHAVEKCNGSGDCRKSAQIGGVMCPSYMATGDEKMTTRARANMMRIALNSSDSGTHSLNDLALKSILDDCLSCKGCLSECPSNVDMTVLKAEMFYQYYKNNRRALQDYFFGFAYNTFRISNFFRPVSNFMSRYSPFSNVIKSVLGIHKSRSLPLLDKNVFEIPVNSFHPEPTQSQRKIYLLADEFTRYHDPELIRKALRILKHLGYAVAIAPVRDSARSQFSKGFLSRAEKMVTKNVNALHNLITASVPLVGIEPSAILGLRDEYPKILKGTMKDKALELSKHCYTLDDFLLDEIKKGQLNPDDFPGKSLTVKVHTHCHQKALCENDITERLLMHFPNVQVEKIPSGCCGMAGSFGYDKSKYELSMAVGELILFPAVREASKDALICANGTSCRQQIHDGTQRQAQHVIEILHSLFFH